MRAGRCARRRVGNARRPPQAAAEQDVPACAGSTVISADAPEAALCESASDAGVHFVRQMPECDERHHSTTARFRINEGNAHARAGRGAISLRRLHLFPHRLGHRLLMIRLIYS